MLRLQNFAPGSRQGDPSRPLQRALRGHPAKASGVALTAFFTLISAIYPGCSAPGDSEQEASPTPSSASPNSGTSLAPDDEDSLRVHAPADPMWSDSEGPRTIEDEQGRLRYIIDLSGPALPEAAMLTTPDPRFPAYQNRRVVAAARELEAEYDIRPQNIISLVGASVIAFLTDDQVELLEDDPRVDRITLDQIHTLSADALSLWTDSGSAEITPWGKKAVGSSTSSSSGAVRVYILDTGVGYHEDLNVVQRLNAVVPSDTTPWKLVGCYPHATHVAGIVGARVNGRGSQGVRPGAAIVSVSVLDPTLSSAHDSAGNCNQAGVSTSAIGLALDWVKADITSRGKVGIVNMSMNSTTSAASNDFGTSGTLGPKLKAVAAPTSSYKGALVLQSAGNYFKDACAFSYNAPSNSDGIMILGALNDHAQPVVPLNGLAGFRNGDLAGSQPGSNYGPCVEAWAPGSKVYSTWAANPQSASTTYQIYAHLSGTSMAAPHAAGLALRFAETEGITTSTSLESRLRTALYSLGSYDKTSRQMSMASANPPSGSAPRSTAYAEYAISKTNFTPVYAKDNTTGNTISNASANDILTIASGAKAYLSLDSWGASSAGCDALYKPQAGGASTALGTGVTQYYWPAIIWQTGTWSIFSNTCPSAAASVVAKVKPTVRWLINGTDQTGKTVGITLQSSSQIKFTSEDTSSCSGDIWTDTTTSKSSGASPTKQTISGTSGTYTPTSVAAYTLYRIKCTNEIGSTEVRLNTFTMAAPTSSTWTDPTRSDWAWDISRNTSGQIAVYWYTYDSSGNPRWYMAVLDPKGATTGQSAGNIYDYEWSTWYEGALLGCTWNGASASCSSRGSMKLTPSSISAASLRWTFDGITKTNTLTRFTFGGSTTMPNLTGAWYPPSQSGWGQSFDVQGSKMLAATTLYDSAGQPLWVSSGYNAWSGTSYTGTLYRRRGVNACPACTGAPSVSSTTVGSFTVNSVNASVSSATYTQTFNSSSGLTPWNRSALPIARLTY